MRSFMAMAGALALGLSTVAASAMPFDATLGKGDAGVTRAAYGCGPGMTRGPGGHCHPMMMSPMFQPCPMGFHRGPHGMHCFRN